MTRGAAPPSLAADIVQMNGQLAKAIRHRTVSCVEVMQAYLDHIERANPHVNAIVLMRDRGELLREAAARDEDLARGEVRGWMHGFPQAIKDLASVKGLPTTQGSPIFNDAVAEADSIFVERMRAAGSIFIGKTASEILFGETPTKVPGTLAMTPVVDRDLVPKYPVAAFQKGLSHRIPLIIGSNNPTSIIVPK